MSDNKIWWRSSSHNASVGRPRKWFHRGFRERRRLCSLQVQEQTPAGQRTKFKAFMVVEDVKGQVGMGFKYDLLRGIEQRVVQLQADATLKTTCGVPVIFNTQTCRQCSGLRSGCRCT